MPKWIVSEKGEPSDKWELSVINSEAPDAEQLARSYAWQGAHKIIVWSCAGSAEYTAPELLAQQLRFTAASYANTLNEAAQQSDATEAKALDMYAMKMRMCAAVSAGVVYDGRGMPVNVGVTPETLQALWDSARDERNSMFDSLDMIELLMSIEEEFDTAICEQEFHAVMQDPKYAEVENVLRWLVSKQWVGELK